MRFKVLPLFAALLMVAACESTPEDVGTGNANAQIGAGGTTTAKAVPGTQNTVTPGTQEDLVVNVGDRVFFDFDKYDLKPEARATLERQAAWLKQYASINVTIEGHCDERGTREYNLALGERRANSVKNYLIALGIPGSRINTISYGKERPAVLGDTEEAYAQNRRGVTVVN